MSINLGVLVTSYTVILPPESPGLLLRRCWIPGSQGFPGPSALMLPSSSRPTQPFTSMGRSPLLPSSFSSRDSRVCPELQCTDDLHSVFFVDTEWKSVLMNRAIVEIMS